MSDKINLNDELLKQQQEYDRRAQALIDGICKDIEDLEAAQKALEEIERKQREA